MISVSNNVNIDKLDDIVNFKGGCSIKNNISIPKKNYKSIYF